MPKRKWSCVERPCGRPLKRDAKQLCRRCVRTPKRACRSHDAAVDDVPPSEPPPGVVSIHAPKGYVDAAVFTNLEAYIRHHIPTLSRDLPLVQQHRRMLPIMRDILFALGRDRAAVYDLFDLNIRWPPPNTSQVIEMHAGCRLTVAELLNMQAATELSVCAADATEAADIVHVPTRQTLPDQWDASVYRNAQRMAVTGPVHVLFEIEAAAPHRLIPLPRLSKGEVWSVSLAGIDMTNKHDRGAYLAADRTTLRREALCARMRLIWFHFLSAALHCRAQVAVACAIGCGAFLNGHDDMVPLYAGALRWALRQKPWPFTAVVVSLPHFGDGGHRSATNFDHFAAEFRAEGGKRHSPVVLTKSHGILSLAYHIASRFGWRVAFMNPSDVMVMRYGVMGMYWERGHVALEEVMAVQTTLLLQHNTFIPDVYDGQRAMKVFVPPVGAA